ncbi:S41 family peptidase [Psychrobacter sp. 2Y5]|uniref:S41 family peptidase n=1 Tax=unclassified Psychrobacter TaxID=196806 RepID=UPI003F462765
MPLSALKKPFSEMMINPYQAFRPMLTTCLLGVFAFSGPTQAALNDDRIKVMTEASEQQKQQTDSTANLQLISLQDNKSMTNSSSDSSTDDFLEDDTGVPDQSQDWIVDDIDNIDAFGEGTSDLLGEGADDNYEDIPREVAKVSLKAISPETLKTFVAVVDLVRREYIEPVNDETLFNNAMSGMLTKLDSHAEFLDAEAYENLRAFTQGDVGDVGIKALYKADADHWVVTEVIKDSPADKKGVAVGDYLHQVGDFKLDDERESNDIKQLLTGIAGSQIDVIVSRAGRRKRAVTLQRNHTRAQMIETRLVDGVAIVKLPAFQETTREKIVQSLIDLDAPITGVILDVRDNPGGVLTSAVDVASLFMDDADVVQVKGRQGDPRILSTRGSALLASLPVAILQNRYSASAAEVLASSLQAQNRATIIGETSYGKGSVQSVIALNDEQAVKLTVAHYLTTAGTKIDKVGVQPDVRLTGSERSWEMQALDLLRPKIQNSGIHLVRKSRVAEPAVK